MADIVFVNVRPRRTIFSSLPLEYAASLTRVQDVLRWRNRCHFFQWVERAYVAESCPSPTTPHTTCNILLTFESSSKQRIDVSSGLYISTRLILLFYSQSDVVI